LVTAKQSNQGALEKSMKEFEQDYEGNKVFVDQTRLKESLEEKFDKDGQNILKKICSLN
jgi:ribosomal protein S17E